MAYGEKRGKGEYPWRSRYKLPDGTYGTEPGFRTEKAAKEWGNEQEADVRRGTWKDPNRGKRTFGDWAATWIGAQHLDGVSFDLYRGRLRLHLLPRWEFTSLADITPIDVEAWARALSAEGAAASSIKTYRGLFATILEDAVTEGLITGNPARPRRHRGKWKETATTEEKVWADSADVLRIANNARSITGDWAYVLILLAAYTGMRWGELVGLERQYVWFDGKAVRVEWQVLERADGTFEKKPPKYGSRRTLLLPPFLTKIMRAFLEDLPADQEYVFLTPRGTHLRRGNFAGMTFHPSVDGRDASYYGTRLRKAGAPAVPGAAGLTQHGLRHGHKVWIDEDGAPAVASAARMGHKMQGMAGVYSHVSRPMENAIIKSLERRWHAAGHAVAKDSVAPSQGVG